MVAQALQTERRVYRASTPRWRRRTHLSDIAELDNGIFSTKPEAAQLTLTPFSGDVRTLKTDVISIVAIDSKGGYQVCRKLPEGRVALFYAERSRGFSAGPRNGLSAGDLVVARETLLDTTVRGESQAIWIEVDLRRFPELLAFVPPPGQTAILTAKDEREYERLRGYVSAALAMCAADTMLLEDVSTRSKIESEIVSRIGAALMQSAPKVGPSKRERKMYDLAKQVESYMWENVEERITLARLCKSAGCRTRSAIYCFKDLFGVGPMTYLKIRRLSEVHRRLREGAGRLRIIDIAADFGFWHMGHFSEDYRRMFGQTASETLAASGA